MLTSDGSFGKILPGSLTSCGKATQWSFAASSPCFNICRFIHGEILDINCCSTIVKSFSSGGTTPGSILFSVENILIGNLSFVHLSHMLFFIFMSILVSLQIEQE